MILQCNLSWCIHDINERYCNFNSINNSSIPFHSLFIVLRALCFLLHHHCKQQHHHQRQDFLQDLSHFLFPYQPHITHYLSTMSVYMQLRPPYRFRFDFVPLTWFSIIPPFPLSSYLYCCSLSQPALSSSSSYFYILLFPNPTNSLSLTNPFILHFITCFLHMFSSRISCLQQLLRQGYSLLTIFIIINLQQEK